MVILLVGRSVSERGVAMCNIGDDIIAPVIVLLLLSNPNSRTCRGQTCVFSLIIADTNIVAVGGGREVKRQRELSHWNNIHF